MGLIKYILGGESRRNLKRLDSMSDKVLALEEKYLSLSDEELIAQTPSEKRENSKMMVLDRKNHKISHKNFFNIVDYLE